MVTCFAAEDFTYASDLRKMVHPVVPSEHSVSTKHRWNMPFWHYGRAAASAHHYDHIQLVAKHMPTRSITEGWLGSSNCKNPQLQYTFAHVIPDHG